MGNNPINGWDPTGYGSIERWWYNIWHGTDLTQEEYDAKNEIEVQEPYTGQVDKSITVTANTEGKSDGEGSLLNTPMAFGLDSGGVAATPSGFGLHLGGNALGFYDPFGNSELGLYTCDNIYQKGEGIAENFPIMPVWSPNGSASIGTGGFVAKMTPGLSELVKVEKSTLNETWKGTFHNIGAGPFTLFFSLYNNSAGQTRIGWYGVSVTKGVGVFPHTFLPYYSQTHYKYWAGTGDGVKQ